MDFGFDLLETLQLLPGILIGFAFHEFAHAQTAVWFGDHTPRLQGRTTLNPFAHIDLIGFILIIFAGFGWAKPVQVNPLNFKNRKRDDILVSIAGPLMNLLLATLFLALMKITFFIPESTLDDTTYEILMNIFDSAAWINVVLFVFNLLPIPPLDGSHIFFGLTGLNETRFYHQLYHISTLILFVLIITNLIGAIIRPPIELLYNVLSSLFF